AGLPEAVPAAEDARGTRLALIGRPNVGKSSLLNRLLGAERTIVAPEPGTTRDAIDTPLIVAGRPYVLIDTAGIRRRGKVREPLERHGAVRALGTLTRADLVLAVLDAAEGMTDQDARLVGRAWEAGRGVVLLANKWDLVPAAYTRYLTGRLAEAFRLVGVPLRLQLRTRRAVSAPRARGMSARPRSRRTPRRGGAPPRPR